MFTMHSACYKEDPPQLDASDVHHVSAGSQTIPAMDVRHNIPCAVRQTMCLLAMDGRQCDGAEGGQLFSSTRIVCQYPPCCPRVERGEMLQAVANQASSARSLPGVQGLTVAALRPDASLSVCVRVP
jgi:hypothetical protein